MIEQNACKYRVKSRARDFTNLLAKSGGSELCSAFCSEIPSLCFHMAFAGILLDRSSLLPDFARRFVRPVALVFTWYLQAFCSITAHFCQILPANFVKSLDVVFTWYLHAFSSITAHFRQILPVDCVKQITMPIRNGFVKGGGKREEGSKKAAPNPLCCHSHR